jgi:tetratricopeptide (TPR) repeat protein
MDLSNSWKRFCFKIKQNLPYTSLTLSPHTFILTVSFLLFSTSLTTLKQPPTASAQSLPVLTPTQPAAVEKLNKGIGLIQQGKLPEAIAAFRQASQLNPQLAPAHYNLGLALRQAGQLQASADAFYQATQVDPNFALAFANLGAALLEGNNLQQARDYLTRALELEPNLGVAHYNYGLLLSQAGEQEQAIAQFKSALNLSQNAPRTRLSYGAYLFTTRQNRRCQKAISASCKN